MSDLDVCAGGLLLSLWLCGQGGCGWPGGGGRTLLGPPVREGKELSPFFEYRVDTCIPYVNDA